MREETEYLSPCLVLILLLALFSHFYVFFFFLFCFSSLLLFAMLDLSEPQDTPQKEQTPDTSGMPDKAIGTLFSSYFLFPFHIFLLLYGLFRHLYTSLQTATPLGSTFNSLFERWLLHFCFFGRFFALEREILILPL